LRIVGGQNIGVVAKAFQATVWGGEIKSAPENGKTKGVDDSLKSQRMMAKRRWRTGRKKNPKNHTPRKLQKKPVYP